MNTCGVQDLCNTRKGVLDVLATSVRWKTMEDDKFVTDNSGPMEKFGEHVFAGVDVSLRHFRVTDSSTEVIRKLSDTSGNYRDTAIPALRILSNLQCASSEFKIALSLAHFHGFHPPE